jgi:hypothetical protein
MFFHRLSMFFPVFSTPVLCCPHLPTARPSLPLRPRDALARLFGARPTGPKASSSSCQLPVESFRVWWTKNNDI